MSISVQGYPKYAVVFERFTERHFVKRFRKKYKDKKWHVTRNAIEAVCANPEYAIENGVLETIMDGGSVLICKYNFAVAGTKASRKRSGNRVIVAVHRKEMVARILLVYHKNDLGKGGETQEWKKMIRNNYSQYKNIV